MDQALLEYRSGQYVEARESAIRAAEAGHGQARDRAAYLAGLAAYQTGDLDTARRWLTESARSADAATAGRSEAVLGLAAEQDQAYLEAAEHLGRAATALEGSDGRRAALHAAVACRRAGDEAAASSWLQVANDPSATFTLQVGAFRERKHAERAVTEVSPVADRHGLGQVEIVPAADERGRPLYLVQVGRFATRFEADRTRSRLGRLQFIVAAAPSS